MRWLWVGMLVLVVGCERGEAPAPEAAAPEEAGPEAASEPAAPAPQSAEKLGEPEPIRIVDAVMVSEWELAKASHHPLPQAWLDRWKDVPRGSISTIAFGAQRGQQVRVEGYLSLGANAGWGFLYVDYLDAMRNCEAPKGSMIRLKWPNPADRPGSKASGHWVSVVGRVVAVPVAVPGRKQQPEGDLEVGAIEVTEFVWEGR